MKMLYLIFVFYLLSSVVFSQSNEKAPFGGKLIDKHTIVVYEREDGSELTSYDNCHTWYLTKEAATKDKLSIPGYVKKSKPMNIVFTSAHGKDYSSYDGRNWVIEDINQTVTPSHKREISGTNNILQLTKLPKNPVESQFIISFILKSDSDVKLIITDILGNLIYLENKIMGRGINKFDIDVYKMAPGIYSYVLSAGSYQYRGNFLKLK